MKKMDGIVDVPFSPLQAKAKSTSIEFHIDHVNHDMNEDPKEVRTQQMRQVNNSLIETQ